MRQLWRLQRLRARRYRRAGAGRIALTSVVRHEVEKDQQHGEDQAEALDVVVRETDVDSKAEEVADGFETESKWTGDVVSRQTVREKQLKTKIQ